MGRKYIAVILACLCLLTTVTVLPAVADSKEIGSEVLSNGGFDNALLTEDNSTEGNLVRPFPWSSGRGWTGDVTVLTETGGNQYVQMTRKAGDTGYMSIIQTNRAVDPGASYLLQMRYKADSGTSPLATIVYRNAEKQSVDSISISLSETDGAWNVRKIAFVAPWKEDECTRFINVELRYLGKEAGTIAWDAVSCIKTEAEPAAILETDEKFYYTETTYGTAFLQKTGLITLPDTTVVDFALKNSTGQMVKTEEGISFASGTASFLLPLEKLVEKETYTVSYTLRSGQAIIETGEETIYRYKRPSMITPDGKITWNNKPFLPVMGYHVQTNNTADYEYCCEVGINVVQFFPWTTNADVIKTRLDLLAEHKLLAFVALYGTADDKAADVVNACKNHPAVFGYMLMDEPLHNGVSEERLERLYKAVRDNDSAHPVYLVESMAKAEKYAVSAKYADIFATDPYPGAAEKAGTYPTYGVELAKSAVGQNKPVMCITQCFPLSGYEPDGEAVRNMTYQALFAGASGIGYYDLRDSAGYNNGALLHAWNRDCWSDMVRFAENELDFIYETFILGAYEKLSEVKTDNVWYQTYRVEDGIRCIAINRTNAVQTVEIPIEGEGGAVRILAGREAQVPTIENGKIRVSLSANSALVLEPAESSLVFLLDGKRTDSLQKGSVTTLYSLRAETDTKFSLCMALYVKGAALELEKIMLSDMYTADAGETVTATLSMDIDRTENRFIKVFICDREILRPIELVYTLGA